MPSTPEPTIVVGVFDDPAGAERARRALQQAHFAASDVGVEPGEEGRALVGPSGLVGALLGMGVPESEARLYDEQHRAGNTIVTVSAGARRAETQGILHQSGAVAIDELAARRRAAPTPSARAEARSTSAGDGTAMPLVEERLVARTQLVETGAVVLRKEIVSETRVLEVVVRREQLVVERHAAPSPSEPPADVPEDLLAARFRALRPGESIRLDLVEDEVVVQRRPVVYEEVVVGKRLVRETRRVSAEVRRENATIERVGGATTDGPAAEDRSQR